MTKTCFWIIITIDTPEPHPAELDGDMAPVFGPVNGGLMGSRELQGGKMLIIKRPQVAKFIFIWAARRKFFPARRIGDQNINCT